MHKHRLRSGLAAAIAFAFATTSTANSLTSFATVGSTDFAMFGFGGMRGIGTGTITVSGVSGTVTRAVLVWQGPTNSASPTANAAVTFNGNAINGTNIGFSDNNCWGFQNSQAYQADVTAFVPGNGSYSLANFTKAGGIDVNGASLLVFYNDGNATNNRDIAVFLGNDSNINNAFDPAGWASTLSGINYTSGTATLRVIVADGQGGAGFDDNGLALNGTTIVPPGFNWDGTTVPNGTGGPANGGLWDHTSYDVTASLTPGPNTLALTSVGTGGDCLSLVSTIFDLPAGSVTPPPPPPTGPVDVPTLSEWGTITLAALTGLLALIGLRRREKENF